MALRRTPLALLLAGGLVIAACGGDDDNTATVDTPAGDIDVDLDDIDTDALESAEDLDDVLRALGIETKANALQSAMGFERFEVVDESNIRIFVEDAELADTEGLMECMIVNGVLDADEFATIVYPDGEILCEK